MSEKQRKKRWWRSVAAVVSTVALGIGGVAVPGAPVAGAYIQDDSLTTRHGDDLGKKPKAFVSLDLADTEVRAGESTTATIKVDSSVPFSKTAKNEYGESDATALIFSIQVDERLEIQLGDSVESNIRWDDGQNRRPHKFGLDEENNELTIEFARVSPLKCQSR